MIVRYWNLLCFNLEYGFFHVYAQSGFLDKYVNENLQRLFDKQIFIEVCLSIFKNDYSNVQNMVLYSVQKKLN